MQKSPGRQTIYIVIFILLCGLSVSALLAHIQQRANEQRVQEITARMAERISETISERVTLYQYGLRGVRGAVIIVGPSRLSRSEFRRYNQTRDIDREFPGARGFGFIRRIAESEEQRFTQRAQADDKPDFAIHQITPHAGDRYVVQYIEPVERNDAAIGLDIASEPNRREAALAAMLTGEATLTAPITLVQVPDKSGSAFLLLLPIYAGEETPTNLSDREASLIGWSFAPLLMQEVLGDLHLDKSQTQLTLTDITDPKTPHRFYQSDSNNLSFVYTHSLPRDLYGRHWQIDFSVSPAFVANLHQLSPSSIRLVGAGVSLLLALLGGVFATYWRQRQLVESEQLRLAAIVSNSSDGIIGKTLDGVITDWNLGAEKMLGFSAREAIGQRAEDLLVPDPLKGEAADILARIGRGEVIVDFETQRRRRDGSLLDVAITASPIRSSNGVIAIASETVRNITLQKAIAYSLLDINQELDAQVQQRTAELAEVNHQFASVLSAASEISIIATDRDGMIQVFNVGAERMLGYRADEMVGKCTPAVIHVAEEVIARGVELSAEYGTAIEGFRVFAHKPEFEGAETREWTYVRKDGSQLLVSLVVTVIRNEVGAIQGFLGIAIDISVRKATEHALAASLETTRAILDTVQNPIITIDAAGIVHSMNSVAERDFGYAVTEVIGKNIKMLMPEPYHDQHDGYLRRYLKEGAPRIIGRGREVVAKRKDGTTFPVHVSVGQMEVAGKPMFVGIIVDLTELQRQHSELMRARDQILLAADVAELGIWSWTLADSSLTWNAQMFDIYDQSLELHHGGLNYEHWRSRIHPEDLAVAEASLTAAVEGRGSYDLTFRVVHRDGQILFVYARAKVERDLNGKAARVIGINRDITEQLALETRLRNAKERADAANAAKSVFLANMSHEIRTPMNAVLGMQQLLQKTSLDLRQRDYIDKANSAAKSLLGLLNDILDFSKIEADKLELDLHPFELEGLLHDLSVVLSGNQTQKDVEVIFDISSSLPAALIGDSFRLQQILINMAGNALKFTERGHVLVSISELNRSNGRIQLRVAVADTGIGINPEQQLRIFESFTQAEASTTRRYGGTGLGLVISRRLIALMGGTLQLASEFGKGSRFWFDIELAEAGPATLSSSLPSVSKPLRVLIADDNTICGEVLLHTIEALGWHGEYVSDGHQAVTRVLSARHQGNPFDVVLMDWRMPGLDGLAAARLIRDTAEAEPVIVMIAAHSREVLADIHSQSNSPVADFLSKPVTPMQLAVTLQRVLHGGIAELASAAPDRPPQLVGLRLLVVEDNALNRQVAQELLVGEGAWVQLAEGGLEGVTAVLSATQQYDAVIMDVQMPDIDGLEATRRIRADQRFKNLPILAMTANVSESDRLQCFAAGMNEHIGKPIDLEELVLTLMALLQLRPPSDKPTSSKPTSSASDTASDTAGIEELGSIVRRFGGNRAAYRKMLAQFEPETMTLLGELVQQIAQRDSVGAAATLHAIKGTAGTMGARALAHRAAELECELKASKSTSTDILSAQHQQELKQLLIESLKQLSAQTALHDARPTKTVTASLTTSAWHAHLAEILPLLEVNDMRAIDLIEALALPSAEKDQAQFKLLADQIQALNFEIAALTARSFLKCSDINS